MKNPHLLGGGVSWPFLTKKNWGIFKIFTQTCPPTEVAAIYIYTYRQTYIHTYVYAVELKAGPRLGAFVLKIGPNFVLKTAPRIVLSLSPLFL